MPTASRARRAALSILAAGLLPLTAGCGDADTDDGAASDATTTTAAAEVGASSTVPAADVLDGTGKAEIVLEVVDNTFEPRYVKVNPGTKVTFTNHGRNTHNVTPAKAGALPAIEGTALAPGATASIVIPADASGVLGYYCSIHGTPRNGQNGAFDVVPG